MNTLHLLAVDLPTWGRITGVFLGVLGDNTVILITARNLAKLSGSERLQLHSTLDALGVDDWDEISYHPDIDADIFVRFGTAGPRPLPGMPAAVGTCTPELN